MAAGNVSRIIHGPGKLVVGPSDLTTPGSDNAYGGTEVGLSNQCLLTPLGVPFRIENEGLGEATDVLEANNRFLVTCFLRGWDDDAITQFFSGQRSAGGTSQHGLFTAPGSRVPGKSSADSTNLTVLFVPEDLLHTDAFILYRAIPWWTDDAEMAFQRQEEFGIPLQLDCLRNGSGNILQVGRLADLSLT